MKTVIIKRFVLRLEIIILNEIGSMGVERVVIAGYNSNIYPFSFHKKQSEKKKTRHSFSMCCYILVDMKPPMGLEQLRLHPHETPQEINDRIFGSFPLYREVKERGSTTPVMDAYRESADPIMLEKILQVE